MTKEQVRSEYVDFISTMSLNEDLKVSRKGKAFKLNRKERKKLRRKGMTPKQAKEKIERAESHNALYAEIPAERPIDEGWEHLGDDYFRSPDNIWLCGPSNGDPTRTLSTA